MSESSFASGLEKELDQLHSEIETFRSGVSYIEHASALIRLAEKATANLEAEMTGKPERIEEILNSLQQSGTSAQETALSLERLLAEFRTDSVITLLDEAKEKLEKGAESIGVRIDVLSSSLGLKLDEALKLLARIEEKTTADAKSLQTQAELHATRLSLIEERTTARQKNHSVLLVLSTVVGFLTLAIGVFVVVKLS
jgi:hypothetical protein